MKVRRTLSLAASAAVVAGVGIASAPTASASEPVTCSNIAVMNTTNTGSGNTFHAQAGDTVTVNVSAPSAVGLTATLSVNLVPVATGTAPVVLSHTYASASDLSLLVGVGTLNTATFAWSCTNIALAAPIPDWVQAYGRANAEATCVDGWNPPWAAGPAGDVVRYTPSWAQWMNDGTGGWVCTRTIPSLG